LEVAFRYHQISPSTKPIFGGQEIVGGADDQETVTEIG